MPLLDTIFQLKGYPLHDAVKQLERIQTLSESESDLYQSKLKWEIFEFHKNNNPLYAEFVKAFDITKWEDIPILTKSSIQIPLLNRLSAGYSAKNAHIHNTSGSSGTPFYFAKDKFCHALTWAIIYNRFNWHQIRFGKDLQARFYGIPLSKRKYYIEKVKDKIANRVRFPVFDLSDSILEKYIQQFKKNRFVYINGYTSSLVLFAKYILKKGIVLNDLCPTLKATFTTSEVCDSIDKDIMSRAFGTPVINEYGAAELDLLGFEDPDGDFLLNYESLFIELLDDNGHPVRNGEEGRVIVTSLYNKAMPFIRYELGDRIKLSNRKKGNYQIIENITGRINDIILLPGGKRSPGLTFYYISKSLLEGGGFMKEFIIRQTALDHFIFEYVADRKISQSEEVKVMEAMDTYLERNLKASFIQKNKLERTTAGKLKHFFSELKTTSNQ